MQVRHRRRDGSPRGRRRRGARALRAARAARRRTPSLPRSRATSRSASRAGRASSAARAHDAATPTSRSSTSCASRAGAACAPATRSRARSRSPPPGRGFHAKITAGLDSGFADSACVSCGACADTCPTDAITEARCSSWPRRTLRRGGAVSDRFDATTTTTCGYCGVGCRLEAHRADGRIVVDQPGDGRPREQGPHLREGTLRAPVRALARPPHRAARSARAAASGSPPGRRRSGASPRRSAASRPSTGPTRSPGLASSRATNEDCYVMQRLMRAAIGTQQHRQLLARLPFADLVRPAQVVRALGRHGLVRRHRGGRGRAPDRREPDPGPPGGRRAHQAGRDQGAEARDRRPAAHRAGRLRRSSTSASAGHQRRALTGWRTW